MVIVSKDEGVLTGFAYFAVSSTLTGSGALDFALPPAFALPFAFFSGFGGSGTSTGLNGFSGPGLYLGFRSAADRRCTTLGSRTLPAKSTVGISFRDLAAQMRREANG